jgi:hypothetical protein
MRCNFKWHHLSTLPLCKRKRLNNMTTNLPAKMATAMVVPAAVAVEVVVVRSGRRVWMWRRSGLLQHNDTTNKLAIMKLLAMRLWKRGGGSGGGGGGSGSGSSVAAVVAAAWQWRQHGHGGGSMVAVAAVAVGWWWWWQLGGSATAAVAEARCWRQLAAAPWRQRGGSMAVALAVACWRMLILR